MHTFFSPEKGPLRGPENNKKGRENTDPSLTKHTTANNRM